ncbi:bifunctional homocysteine S-methyltransferase/methylenetetrahydrofolate reductase [Haliovirga abyssi]|uniref:Bifunctional homocysteine S-methyltransferase/5,10-methylenetetrahydrofolate reductase n=1 Tax=Haliovirga abyssi TaxID=2996794 RepID=A0AAU9DVJ5_9FUSO|nr:bifunctional homocysteine S-methyltransferase/methylenetetrahydrofolate reductase [Haliovirga abyssi]BDU50206.1 bifunctional homocysteine S-methyltransferase/5,10-methylenetetrahydrofolate reductase [Haliovirga abyssi]
MDIREYLKENRYLITDGAMGTYYSQITKKYTTFSEVANLDEPEIIEEIHKEYIKAGAKLIRTNTFSANSYVLRCDMEKVKKIIEAASNIAKKAVGEKEILIAADIGPIISTKEEESNEVIKEYKVIIDSFIEQNLDIFIFETFSSYEYLEELSKYIKEKKSNAFILTQFALMPNGYTRKGISGDRLIKNVKKISTIDAYGFNCGTGPMHLYNNLKKLNFNNDIISVLPNAGFPEIVNERTVYTQNPEYFSELMKDIAGLGAKIIGGCCGTTPEHIKAISEKLIGTSIEIELKEKRYKKKEVKIEKENKNNFREKLQKGKFVIAVELDPPFGIDTSKIMNAARIFSESGKIDTITVSDSPIGKVRINSLMIANKIKRELGMEVIPHICCRDRNIIALKSDLLGANIENLQNILIVTGDPIPSEDRNEIKSVFNLNSMELIKLANELNKEKFSDNKFFIGGALNLNVLNKGVEWKRMKKKRSLGAEFFLTQPIYDDTAIEYLKSKNHKSDTKILAGIMPLVSYRNAQFLNNEIPGITIPEYYLSQFKNNMTREEAQEVGIKIAVEIGQKLKKYVDGFYFITPFNRANMILDIIKRLEI